MYRIFEQCCHLRGPGASSTLHAATAQKEKSGVSASQPGLSLNGSSMVFTFGGPRTGPVDAAVRAAATTAADTSDPSLMPTFTFRDPAKPEAAAAALTGTLAAAEPEAAAEEVLPQAVGDAANAAAEAAAVEPLPDSDTDGSGEKSKDEKDVQGLEAIDGQASMAQHAAKGEGTLNTGMCCEVELLILGSCYLAS